MNIFILIRQHDHSDLSQFDIPGYKIIHQGWRCTRHGGLLIYLNKAYSYKLRNLPVKSSMWEGLFIDVSGENLTRPLTIGNIYSPPHNNNNNETITKFINELTPIIEDLQKQNSYASIVGDFNINLLQIKEREIFEDFLDLMCTNNFYPKISLPTRYSNHSCSLIDQIFCKVPNKENVVFSSSVIVSKISDHFPCVVNMSILKETKKSPKYIYVRQMKESIIQDFRNDLMNSNIISKLNPNLMSDVNIEYNKFEKIILNAYNKHFPMRKVKVNKHRHKLSEWITTGIIKSIEHRDKMYKRLKMLPSDSTEQQQMKLSLKTFNSYLNKCIRAAKKDYYHREFLKYKHNIRKTWDTLKTVLGKNKCKSESPSYFLNNDEIISGNTNIANKFNEYFTKIGPELARKIDTKNKLPYTTYLTKPCASSFEFMYTTPIEICNLIKKLKPKMSSGMDNIPLKLLTKIGDIISTPLSLIINQSLCSGSFPSKLKLAKVIPIFKKNDNKKFDNYRPISLLSSVSKIFERVVFNQLYNFLQEHNLLFESQYGFRKLHSTDLAALELIDRINKQIDQRKIPFSIFLDLSKAFDTLNHDILMKKLHYHGVRNNTLNWFHSYLTNRAQYIEYNETKSSLLEIETRVPQGSILGPLLFLIYVNDIHMVSRSLNFILYADDTTLTSPICSFTQGGNSSISKVSNLINSELTKISDWFAVNKLSLNAEKTKFMIFHNHQKIITQNKIPCLKINNTNIERVTEFNFLGLTINEHLTWKSHAAKVANKISRTLGVMNRLKRYLPLSALKTMYDSLILSQLQFGITCWGFEWNRIFKLQKRAVRIMSNSKYNSHTEPLFKELKLLKISDIFKIQCMKFWYKFKNKTLPSFFKSFFKYNYEMHDKNTRNRNSLHLFPTRTEGAKNVLRHHVPELLEEFPEDLLTRRSENDDTPQPLDQWTNSPFIGQQVGNWSICHALWPIRKPIVHPRLYPTHISFIPSQSKFPFLKYGY